MADDRKQRAPQDASPINIHADDEIHDWTQELGVSRERLVDDRADDVRGMLGRQHA